ncbi:MAG: hypothetical protein AAGE18_14085 [Pseudomonadota bacterium]
MRISAALGILALASTAACAVNPQLPEMIVADETVVEVPIGTPLANRIFVGDVVNAAEQSFSQVRPQLNNKSVIAALEQSLAAYGMQDLNRSEIRVDVDVLSTGQAPFSEPLGTVRAEYRLSTKAGVPIFQETIETPYRAPTVGALTPDRFSRRALERGVRDNIQAFIDRLLDLQQQNPELFGPPGPTIAAG